MKVAAVLNRDGGTFKTTDLAAYGAHLEACFRTAGHDIDWHAVPSHEIAAALTEAASDRRYDTLIAGGGDGTVSAAAGIAWKAGRALGVLPAGTMNLFARSLSVPLDLTAAAEALASGSVRPCDIATANGRPFVHQYAAGLLPSIIKRREETPSRSRIGKIVSGIAAALDRLRDPPSFPVEIDLDGRLSAVRVSSIAVSNNPYGQGHMPYADKLDGGVLGVYRAGALKPPAMMVLAADLMAGRWVDNADLITDIARRVVLRFPRSKHGTQASIDGELIPLTSSVTIRIHPGQLHVLRPGGP